MSPPRLAVLSDIHGNHFALRAALEHVDRTGVDALLFLGDYFTDFPGVRQVLSLLGEYVRRYPCFFIRGNREDYLLSHHRGDTVFDPEGTTGSLYYTYHQLTEAELDLLASLPISMVARPPRGDAVTLCHGSPQKTSDQILLRPDEARRHLAELATDLMVCGHSHRVGTYRLGRRTACFVGSVGLPEGYPGEAQFAYLTFQDGQWLPQNLTIPYDVRAAIEDFDASGILQYDWVWSLAVRQTALTGINLCEGLASRAYQLSRLQGVPNARSHWEQAAREIGLL